MLTTCHQPFVNDLGGIVPPSINVYAFLDDGVGARSQSLSDLVSTRLDLRGLASGLIHFESLLWELSDGLTQELMFGRRAGVAESG